MTDLRDCVNCGGALKPVFDDYPNEQYDNALEVTISGGYRMFFDNIDGERRVLLCHDCAHEACEALPWPAQLIQPHDSHAHTAQYRIAHPELADQDKSARTSVRVRRRSTGS
jgi:hypothetical protein